MDIVLSRSASTETSADCKPSLLDDTAKLQACMRSVRHGDSVVTSCFGHCDSRYSFRIACSRAASDLFSVYSIDSRRVLKLLIPVLLLAKPIGSLTDLSYRFLAAEPHPAGRPGIAVAAVLTLRGELRPSRASTATHGHLELRASTSCFAAPSILQQVHTVMNVKQLREI